MKQEICNRFNSYDLHDSRLTSFKLIKGEEDSEDICFEMELIKDIKPPDPNDPWKYLKIQWQPANLIFKGCLLFKVDLNLIAKRCLNDMISESSCSEESELKNNTLREMVGIGTKKAQELQIDEYLHFRILLVYPAGELNIIAKDYCICFDGDRDTVGR